MPMLKTILCILYKSAYSLQVHLQVHVDIHVNKIVDNNSCFFLITDPTTLLMIGILNILSKDKSLFNLNLTLSKSFFI